MSDEIIVGERERQRRLSGDSASREYVITGTQSERLARDAMLAYAPTHIAASDLSLLPRKSSQCQVDEIATGIYEGRMAWGSSGASQTTEQEDARASFDIGGLSIQRSTSITTVASYVPPDPENPEETLPAPNFHGAINVRENGEVGGVELPAQGSMVYSETWYKPVDVVNQTYIRNLMNLYLCVASGSFHGFNEGELLFLGAAGNLMPTGDLWQIDFRFGVSENRTDITVGNITDIEKRGWDYLWTYFEPVEDDEAMYVVRRPRAVYVEQVHEYRDFSVLGI